MKIKKIQTLKLDPFEQSRDFLSEAELMEAYSILHPYFAAAFLDCTQKGWEPKDLKDQKEIIDFFY